MDSDIPELGFYMDRQYSPAPEPGPSRVSKYGQVFNIRPQSEAESEWEADQDDNTYVWFLSDLVPDSEDAEPEYESEDYNS